MNKQTDGACGNEVESFNTARNHVFAGYASPRNRMDDDAYIILLRRHLTSAHACLQRAKPLVDEYEAQYRNAVEHAGRQVWASMQRHAGDPRWELRRGSLGEECT